MKHYHSLATIAVVLVIVLSFFDDLAIVLSIVAVILSSPHHYPSPR